ncbi:GerMN domain-containing protein [Plantactinospora solaniradicis]|uniref:GerMN domain-containing protein n=1 Tax=Plantactinospora solaniradicis TaxID=1723736 RepID=A0ABW1KQY1_9ACTN
MDEDLLRRVLAAEADRIEPAPGALPLIQHRIQAGVPGPTRRGWWTGMGRSRDRTGPRPSPDLSGPRPPSRRTGVGGSAGGTDRRRWAGWSPLAAGAVTVATLAVAVVGVGLASSVMPTPSDRRTGSPAGVLGAEPTTSPAAPSQQVRPGPTPPGGPEPSVGTTSGTAPTASLAVYYQGGDPDRPRLYREFHRLWLRDGSAADRITAAVRNLLDGPTGMDPNYLNAWPTGTDLRGVSVSDGTATVDLAGAARNEVGEAVARMAVQQLVWTVTAVPGVSGVRLRLDGTPVDRLWGRVDVSGVLRRGPAVEVLAPVWLIAPQHGDAVGRTFQVHLAGILPEATAQLRIQRDGRTVSEETITLSIAGPAQGEYRHSVTLPPGRYTLTAYAISLADGREQHLDDHIITVR